MMDGVFEHLECYLGEAKGGWVDPEIPEQRFQIVEFIRNDDPAISTFSTLGLAKRPFHLENKDKHIRHELMIIVNDSHSTGAIPALLSQITMETIDRGAALLRGEVIPRSGAIVPGCGMEALYVAPPVFQPDEFGQFDTGKYKVIFAWLIPIFKNEERYISSNGWREFESRLIEFNPELTNLHRQPMNI